MSFVLNYEEGAEHTLWNGDSHSEAFLNETAAHRGRKDGRRDLYVESQYEYGSRAGLPRLLKLFKKYGYSWTTWTNARALESSAYYGPHLVAGGHEIACESSLPDFVFVFPFLTTSPYFRTGHGNRWITQTELYEEKPPVSMLTAAAGAEEEAAFVPFQFALSPFLH